MLKSLLTTVCISASVVFATLAAEAHSEQTPRRQKVAFTQTPAAHNLKTQSVAAPLFKDAHNPLKAKTAQADAQSARKNRGLSIHGITPKRRAAGVDHTQAMMFESFEDAEAYKPVAITGWTQQSKGATAVGDDEHWVALPKEYAEYFMFPVPADGNMMIGCFYNDDTEKDEWIISPEVAVTNADLELSFYWYTTPLYIYAVDRFHVDFDNGVFTDREINFNFQVLVKPEGGDWTTVFDLEKKFSNVEYAELSETDYETMQLESVSLAEYVGKKVQIALRYFGIEGNTVCVDAVCVDFPPADAAYEPDYSRLFYGFSPDEDLWWAPASIEFYPVCHPVTWYNTSNGDESVDYSWAYYDLDMWGAPARFVTNQNPDYLQVTYRPDYTSPQSLMNNFYYMPELIAKSAQGGIGTFTDKADFFQAGGTTEVDYGEDSDGYVKYTATNFDILTEGLSIHMEGDDDLGFYLEPIFGKSINTDAWWKHYCFPNTATEEKYAYVDGFANMFFPHASAPLVVKGVSAAAMGTITDDAEFTAKVYKMTEEGVIVETPIAEKTLKGSELIKFPTGMGREYLVMNFNFDNPVIFSVEGTGYAYFVEISGYHNDQVEYFAPLQSVTPNEHEWCLSFYHLYSSFDEIYERDLTDQMGYVAMFKTDWDEDLYTSFAIGLDACYPWLQRADAGDVVIDDDNTTFTVQGYYDAADYTVSAPEWLEVSLAGRYYTTATVKVKTDSDDDRSATINIKAPGVELAVPVMVKGKAGVDSVIADSTESQEVYNLQGIRVRSNASDIENLPAGIYVSGGKKIIVK